MQNIKPKEMIHIKLADNRRCIIALIFFLLMSIIFIFNIDSLKDYDYENFNAIFSMIFINVLICALLIIKIDMIDILKKVYSLVWFTIVPFILLEISGIVIIKWYDFTSIIFYKNLLIYFVLQIIIYAITNRIKVSIMISYTIWWVAFIVEYFVILARGIPIIPADLYSISTAAKVAGSYSFSLDINMFNLIQVYLLVALVTFMYVKEPYFDMYLLKKQTFRLLSLVASGICVFGITTYDFEENAVGFYQYRFNSEYGIAYNMYMNFNNMKVSKPDNYDSNAVCELINDETYLSKEHNYTKDKVNPNIIVVMNESFSDIRVLGDIKTNIPFLTNYESISKENNSISGDMLVSVFGGNTCNTEFEFLTGYSMLAFPNGTSPYNQYITNNIKSICTHLVSMNYGVKALHPYWSNCWQRDTNYNYLGFEEFISGEDFVTGDIERKHLVDMGGRDFGDEVEYIRNYISDNEDYKKLISLYEEKDKDKPLFTFNITIQNHGGYSYYEEDFIEEVRCENYPYDSVNQYLSLIKISDDSLAILIDYFREYEEPTIILFFGDHQPSLETVFYEDIFGKTKEELSLEEMLKKYTVKYLMWANYDINDIDIPKMISPNYLQSILLEAAGIEQNGVSRYALELMKNYPAISGNAVLRSDGTWLTRDEALADDRIQMYNSMAYYGVFEEGK